MKIFFENIQQAHLFECELKGQLSDGMWENAKPYGHYIVWCNARVFVDAENPRIVLEHGDRIIKHNYNFSSKTLIDAIGQRMINIAKLAKAGFSRKTSDAFNDVCAALFVNETKYWVYRRRRFFDVFKTKENYYSVLEKTEYTEKDLKKDLKAIKKLFKKTFA